LPDGSRRGVDAEAFAPIARFLSRTRRRLIAGAALQGVAAGAAVAGAISALTRLVTAPHPLLTSLPLTLWALVAALFTLRASFHWTPRRVALAVERRSPHFENLLATSEEIRRRHAVHPIVGGEVVRQTIDRLERTSLPLVAPIGPALLIALAVSAGALLVGWRAAVTPESPSTEVPQPKSGTAGIVSYTVRIEPPAYTARDPQTLASPAEVRALEGSRVRIDAVADTAVELTDSNGAVARLSAADGRHTVEIVADRTKALLLRTATPTSGSRLISLSVEGDRRPSVRISTPGRDLVFPASTGRVPIQVHAEDDIGLASVEVRFTRVSGSGEAFTFQEGSLPLTLTRPERTRWQGNAVVWLEALQLREGDTWVYRATARDGKPGADLAVSESFVIEIGRLGEAASGGFALPEEKQRQAISQQMVIVKTERLQAAKSTMSADGFVEQSRALAVEQRMVRAEFVFMTGGEVEDEIVEAERSDQLVEGRFENEGQVELLNAIREMSRAEAALNDADTARALAFERAALAALQRAFDRRRYLLRTLPERARIDPDRRLTGDRATARSWNRPSADPREPDQLRELRALMHALSTLSTLSTPAPEHPSTPAPEHPSTPGTLGTLGTLGTQLLALDPEDPATQKAARALIELDRTPRTEMATANAVTGAMQVVSAHARKLLAPSRPGLLPRDPVVGRFSAERVR
jgi:hypothetical protein